MKENEKVLIHSYMSYRQRNAKNGRHNEKNELLCTKKITSLSAVIVGITSVVGSLK